MKNIIKKALFLAILMASLSAFAQSGNSFKIIVNADNNIDELSKDQVSDLFLKKDTKWSNGEKVIPVDLSTESTTRQVFTKNVHGKSVSAIKAYWQKKIFTGKGIPPVEKSSDFEVLTFVKMNPGAIGYVSVKTVANGAKIVTIND